MFALFILNTVTFYYYRFLSLRLTDHHSLSKTLHKPRENRGIALRKLEFRIPAHMETPFLPTYIYIYFSEIFYEFI